MTKLPPKTPTIHDDSTSDGSMSLLSHLREFRRRLLRFVFVFLLFFAIAFAHAQEIYDFLAYPLAQTLENMGRDSAMIYTSMPEVFFAYVRVALFAALCLSFPYGAIELWLFIAPALYKNEKRVFLPLLLLTPIFFGLGAFFAYQFVLPTAWQFFASFAGGEWMTMRLEAKVGEYLSLAMALIFSFGAAFLLPIFLFLLVHMNIVSRQELAAQRRYAVVVAFVLAAILTPPDVISQILLAVPLILLYEGTLLLIYLTHRKSNE